MRKLWLVLLASELLLLPACRAADSAKNEMIQEQKGDSKAMQPVSSGYVDVNGINIYHEIYGAGRSSLPCWVRRGQASRRCFG